MELRRFSYFSFRDKNFSKTLSKLSRACRASAPGAYVIKIYKGLVFLLMGIALSFSAHEWSSQLGATFFGQTTWPPSRAWSQTLKDLGFVKIPLTQNQSLLQHHPHPFQASDAIWFTAEGTAVYVADSPYQPHQAELWTRGAPNLIPLNWTNLGSGITGFNELIQKAEATIPAKIKLQNRIWVDPKEIRY